MNTDKYLATSALQYLTRNCQRYYCPGISHTVFPLIAIGAKKDVHLCWFVRYF